MLQAEIASFLRRYVTGNHSEIEHNAFIEWLREAPVREIERVMDEYSLVAADTAFSENRRHQIIAKIESALDRRGARVSRPRPIETKVLNLKKNRNIRSAIAAAAVIAVLVASGYWWKNRRPLGNTRESAVASVVQDVPAPKTTLATITLGNGRVIYVDSINSGMLASQGNVNIVKTAKTGITYKSGSEQMRPGREIQYNTLYNPRGSRAVSLTLGDGTRVWLNAESTLRYPVAFSGKERKVEITGEAYFEVAKDAQKRFLVRANDVTTEVLGTRFNINAYTEEGRTVITLLEGAVRVRNRGKSVVIRPTQQVIVTNDLQVLDHADLEASVAWKNGEFIMKSANIGTVMRQISKWYDVDVIYEGEIPKGTISGEVSRKLNLSQILHVLSYSGVHVKMEGKKVEVIP
jgi:ferric-dicitrate binding protein FerR (iron transport regulator)